MNSTAFLASEQRLERVLRSLFESVASFDGDDLERAGLTDIDGVEELLENHVTSFRNAGLLTSDHGVVLRLSSGYEFQLTVKMSDAPSPSAAAAAADSDDSDDDFDEEEADQAIADNLARDLAEGRCPRCGALPGYCRCD